MSAEKAEVPKSIPDPKPIASGSEFIGLCALRNGAFHMLWWRARDGVAFNTAGLATSAYLLTGEPTLKSLLFLVIATPLAPYFNGYWRELVASAKKTEEYWTEEIVQLEERNGIEGGCRVFICSQFPPPGSKPKVPRVLRNIRRACTVLWWVVWINALVMFLSHKELPPWIWKLLRELWYFLY